MTGTSPHEPTADDPLDIGVYGARGVPSTYSGYETFLSLLLPQLVQRGDRVTMYCRSGEGFDNEPWNGVERRVLPALPGKNFSTLSHGIVAAAAARWSRHDVVLVVNVANAAFCALGRFTGQPVVLNVDGQEWLRGKWGSTARKIFHGSARISPRTATALVADGAAMADVYRTEFAADTTVIPYCVTTDSWTADPATPARHELTPGGYLLIAGRHNPENNIDTIVEEYLHTSHDLPIVVLGTANYDSPVTARIGRLAEADPRVRMLGHVGDRDAFFDLVHHSAVYLHGHSVGGTNPSLIEAMGVRARILALDTPFSRETLGPAGELFSLPGAPQSGSPPLGAAVGVVLGGPPDEDAARRDAAGTRAAEVYGVDVVVGAYRQLLAVAAHSRGVVHLPTMWQVA